MKRSSEIKSILSGRDISKEINLLKEAKRIISSGQTERMNDAVLYMISAENKIIDRLRLNGSLSKISSDMSLDNTLSFLEIYSNRIDIDKSFFKSADNMGFKIEKTSSRKSYESGSISKWLSNMMGYGDAGDSYDIGVIKTFSNRRLLSEIRSILSKGSELHGRQPNILASAFEPANTRVFQTEAENLGLFEYAKLTLKIKDRKIKRNMAIKFGIAISTLFSNNQFQEGDAEYKAKNLMIFQRIDENSEEAQKIRSSINFCLAKYDQDDGEELKRYLNSEHFITLDQRKAQLAGVINELSEYNRENDAGSEPSNREERPPQIRERAGWREDLDSENIGAAPETKDHEDEDEDEDLGETGFRNPLDSSDNKTDRSEGTSGGIFIKKLLDFYKGGGSDAISAFENSFSAKLPDLEGAATAAKNFVERNFKCDDGDYKASKAIFDQYMSYLSKNMVVVADETFRENFLKEFVVTVFTLLFPYEESCKYFETYRAAILSYDIRGNRRDLLQGIMGAGSSDNQNEMVNKTELLSLSKAICNQIGNLRDSLNDKSNKSTVTTPNGIIAPPELSEWNEELKDEEVVVEEVVHRELRGATLEDLLQLNKRAMQALLKNVDKEDLPKALKDVPLEILEFFLSNLSRSEANDLRDEIEFSSQIKESQVLQAQENIVVEALKLMDQGTIYFEIANPDSGDTSGEEVQKTKVDEDTVSFEEDESEESTMSVDEESVIFEEDSEEDSSGNNTVSSKPDVIQTEEEEIRDVEAEAEAEVSSQEETETTAANRSKPLADYFSTETLSSVSATSKIIRKILFESSADQSDEAKTTIVAALNVLGNDATPQNTEVKALAKSFVEKVLEENETYEDLAAASKDVESSSLYTEILEIANIQLEETIENLEDESEVIVEDEKRTDETYEIEDVSTKDIDSGISEDVETSETQSLIDRYESEDKFLERVAAKEFLESSENMKKVVISLYNIAHERGLVKSYKSKEGVLKDDSESSQLKHYFASIFKGKGNKKMSVILDKIFGSASFLSDNRLTAADMIYKCLKSVGAGIDEDRAKSYATESRVIDIENRTIKHFSDNLSSIRDSIFDEIREENLNSYLEEGIEDAIDSKGYSEIAKNDLVTILLSDYFFNKINGPEAPEKNLEIFLEAMKGITEFPTPVIESFAALLGGMKIFDENRNSSSEEGTGLCNAYLFALRDFLRRTIIGGSVGFFAFPHIGNKKVRATYVAPHTAFIVRFKAALEGYEVSSFSRKYSEEEMDKKFSEFKNSGSEVKRGGSSEPEEVAKAKEYIKQYTSSASYGGVSDLAIIEDAELVRSNLLAFAKEKSGRDINEGNFGDFISSIRFSETEAEKASCDHLSRVISSNLEEKLSALFKKTESKGETSEVADKGSIEIKSKFDALVMSKEIYLKEIETALKCMQYYVRVIEDAKEADPKKYVSPIESKTRSNLLGDFSKASELLDFITNLKEEPMPTLFEDAWKWPNLVNMKSCQTRSMLVISNIKDEDGNLHYPEGKQLALAEAFSVMRELLSKHSKKFSNSILSVEVPEGCTVYDLIMSEDEEFGYFDYEYVVNKMKASISKKKINLSRYLNITNEEVFSIFVPENAKVALNAIDSYIIGKSTSVATYNIRATDSITNSFTRRVAVAIRKNDIKILEDEATGYNLESALANSFNRSNKTFNWNCESVVRNAFRSVISALESVGEDKGRLFGSREDDDNAENLRRVGISETEIGNIRAHLGESYFSNMEIEKKDDGKFEIFRVDGKRFLISEGVIAGKEDSTSDNEEEFVEFFDKGPKIISIDSESRVESLSEEDSNYSDLLEKILFGSSKGDSDLNHDKAITKIFGKSMINASRLTELYSEESLSDAQKSQSLYSYYEKFAESEKVELYEKLNNLRKEYYALREDQNEENSEEEMGRLKSEMGRLKGEMDELKGTFPHYLERSNVRLRNIKSSPGRLEGASFTLLASDAGVDLASIGNHRATLLELEKVREEFISKRSIPAVYSEKFEDVDIFNRYLTDEINNLSSIISNEDDVISAKIQKTIIKKSIYSDGRISLDFLEKMFEVCFSESSVERTDFIGTDEYSYPERYALINANQTNLNSLIAAYNDFKVHNKDDIFKQDEGNILTLLFGVREIFNNMVRYLEENEDRIEKEIRGSNNLDKNFDRRNVNQAYAYSKITETKGEFKKYFLFKFHTDKDGLLFELVREMNTARGLYASSEGEGSKTIEKVKRMIEEKKAIFSRKKDSFIISENNYKGSGYMAHKATIELMRSFNISEDIIYIVEGLCKKLKELTYSIGDEREDILPYFDKNILPLVFSNLDLYGYSTFKENTLSVLAKSIIYAQRGSIYSGEDKDLSGAIIYKDIAVEEKEDILLEVSKFVDFSDLIHAELSEYSSDEKINTYVSYNAGLVLGGLSSLAKRETRSDNFTDDDMKNMSLLEVISDDFLGRPAQSLEDKAKNIFWPTDEQKIADWPYKVHKISGVSPALMEVAKSSSVNIIKALSPNKIRTDILGVLRSLNRSRPLFLNENDIMETRKDDMLALFEISNGIEGDESIQRFEEGFESFLGLEKEAAKTKVALLFSKIISLINNMINISQLVMTDNSQEMLEKLFINSCKTISDDFLVKYFIYRNSSKSTDTILNSKVKDILENIKKSFCAISAAKKALGSSRRPIDILNEELASERFKLTKYYKLVDAIFSETIWQDNVKYTLMSRSVAQKTEAAKKIKNISRDNSENTGSSVEVSVAPGGLLALLTGDQENQPVTEANPIPEEVDFVESESTVTRTS